MIKADRLAASVSLRESGDVLVLYFSPVVGVQLAKSASQREARAGASKLVPATADWPMEARKKKLGTQYDANIIKPTYFSNLSEDI